MTAAMCKDLRLTTQHIIDLVGEPEFYRRVPAYFFMREQGLVAVDKYKKAIAGEGDAECGGCQEQTARQQLLQTAVVSFTNVTLAMHKHEPGLLIPLREYIQSKLSYPLGELTLYYKREGSVNNIAF